MGKGDKLTIKQDQYCLNRNEGMSQRIAYRGAYNTANMSDSTVDRNACELEKNTKIIARLTELRNLTQDASVATVLERKQIATQAIRGELTETEIIYDAEGKLVSKKVKTVARAPFIAELNKMENIYSDTTNIQNNILVINGKPIHECSDDELIQIAIKKQIEGGK